MKIRFWGVRGSIPCPGPGTVKYGGNTPCIELRINNRLIIIDAGSGIRELGNYLLANDMKEGPLETSIYLTHTHWDHIMGFPFFTPLYIPSTKLQVYGPVSHEQHSLASIVGGQMTYLYFPVRQEELAAQVTYTNLKEDRFELDDSLILTTKYLNHPVLCLGYRFECQGKIFCTAYDTEPFRNLFAVPEDDPSYDPMLTEEGNAVATEQNALLESFFKDADVLVQDAQYTRSEYENGKQNWGHTDMEHAIDAARRANVKKLILFHHDPMRNDDQMDTLAADLQNNNMEIIFAREGMEIEI